MLFRSSQISNIGLNICRKAGNNWYISTSTYSLQQNNHKKSFPDQAWWILKANITSFSDWNVMKVTREIIRNCYKYISWIRPWNRKFRVMNFKRVVLFPSDWSTIDTDEYVKIYFILAIFTPYLKHKLKRKCKSFVSEL